MTVSRAFRLLLSSVALLIVAWAFFDVGRRSFISYRAERNRPITLTVLHWGDQGEDRVVGELTQRFMDENPSVRIVRINTDPDQFESKLKTMLAAGTPPDVFYLRPELLPDLASMKLLMPLDDRFAKEPPAWKADFFPILIDAFRYSSDAQRIGPGGTLYGLPKDFTTAGFYVNLDLFAKAGIPIPYNGWTWDEFEADMKKITALTGTPGFGDRQIFGGVFDIWPTTLRNFVWTYGGEFFGPGGFRDVTLDSPQCQAALQMIYRMRLIDKTVYNFTGIAKDGSQEFYNGNIGCEGPIGRWKAPRYKDITSFRWDVVPVPYATEHVSQMFYNAWAISSASEHPDEAYRLLKYFCSRDGQIRQAHLGLSVPCLQSVAYSDDFLNPPGLPKTNTRLYLDALKYARLEQLPREPEWLRLVNDKILKSIQLGQESTLDSAQGIKAAWLAELDSPLRRRNWSPMRWDLILGATVASLATLVAILWWRARREKIGPLDRAQERAGWGFIAPWLIGFLVLTLGPMIASLLLSFTRWSAMVPLGAAESVGLANFRQLIIYDPTFYQSLKVTLYFVVLAVPTSQIAALAIALLMNTKVRGITLFRTIFFVPSVVSGVALAVLWLQIFNKDYGLLNSCLRPIAHLFGTTPPDWFGQDAKIWATPAFVIMALWGVGSGMIIYLAGLKGISASLYEAATIDGAGPVSRFWNVTLPMLSPLIFYNLVMGIIGSFQIFTQAKVMINGPGPDNATLYYVYNLFRQAFEFHNMGYASAMAWILFLIVLILTLLMFRGSRSLVYYEGLKL